jgi:aryl-alcohol dehydrogenase-like predicted oxidoreductase
MMAYTTIGSTGVEVSRVCLGTCFRSGLTTAGCRAVIDEAIEQGINFIDCANMYHGGGAETAVGEAIRGRRDQFVITSKVGADRNADRRREGLATATIYRGIEATLSRLGTDYVDFYLCHLPDAETPLAETLGVMDDLVRQGKIRYAGCSNFDAGQLDEALAVSKLQQYTAFACHQVCYNLLDRRLDDDVIPLCAQQGIAVTAYGPTAKGLLAGRYRYGEPPPPGTMWHRMSDSFSEVMTPRAGAVIDAVVEIARQRDRTPVQVALAWCLAQPGITAVITGADTAERVRENSGAAGWTIDDEAMARLEQVSTNSI